MRHIPRAKVSGPLAPFADGFRARLDSLGYTRGSTEFKIGQVARLSTWLECQALEVGDLSSARVETFLGDLPASRNQLRSARSLRPLMEWLRAEGQISDDPPQEPRVDDDLIDRYRSWMVTDRGLAARTVVRYEKAARSFLGWRARAAGGGTGVEGLDAASVTAYLLAEVARGLAPGSLQGRVAELRSFLRFCYLQGWTRLPLTEAVPPVPGWKDTAVPVSLGAAGVATLLASCDRTKPTGMRDFAMLMLLARLGLRAAEVGGLRLSDFDWRGGELVVHGKARRNDRLPLPADVGEAVATYVIEARPKSTWDNVFLTAVAPPRPMGPTAVSQTVWRQCRLAGLEPVRAHRLRHALATDLLGHGFTLPEIAELLRQADLTTTAVYAKVDHVALRELALPWPAALR